MDLFPLVKELTELNGPVGHEQPVADYLLADRPWGFGPRADLRGRAGRRLSDETLNEVDVISRVRLAHAYCTRAPR
ncbi:MAG: hypothetical protein DCC58_14255 [Chloroflexi bacterium]|nr:MAG: hypothetical protein DCC58_14255 [Chloroflexota bacterium]